MIARPKLSRALLPSLLFVVVAALPVGTIAQTSPQPSETSWLSASMSEARRSPFHGSTSVSVARFSAPSPSGAPVSEGFQLADSANDPSFREVFLPTLLVTAAAYYVLFRALQANVDQPFDLGIAAATATWLLAPPAAAKRAGGSFGTALLGSALGVGANLVLLEAAGDGRAVVVALPFLQAGLTTWLSLVSQ